MSYITAALEILTLFDFFGKPCEMVWMVSNGAWFSKPMNENEYIFTHKIFVSSACNVQRLFQIAFRPLVHPEKFKRFAIHQE